MRGGARRPVNHSQEAGLRITERARLEELLNKANSSALRNDFYPSASNINWGPTDDVKTCQIFHINVPMDY